MSIALVTEAFKASLPTTPKFVLVALCDIANDQGECFPGVTLLMERCSLGERTVQGALSEIEKAGYLRREFRSGRATLYTITPPSSWPDPRRNCGGVKHTSDAPTPAGRAGVPPQQMPPAAAAPPQQMRGTPAVAAPPPPQILRDTPAVAAPITVKEPSSEPSRNQKKRVPPVTATVVPPVTVTVADLVSAGFDEATAAEFIACKAERKAPLTVRAWKDHLAEAAKAGWTPKAAAEKVMAKTWKGFEAAYVAKANTPGRAPSKHTGFDRIDYREGVTEDGSFN